MQMLNNLARRPAVIAQQIIAVRIHRPADGTGYLADARKDLPQKLCRAIVQMFNMGLGNHQGVAVAYWAVIQKNEDRLILVYPGSRYFPGYDLTENAIIRAH
jgi:hypothetical protein